jgi:hypothetical protein
VATAALAVLAGTLALYTYIAQNFSPPWLFYAFMTAGAFSLVASIFIGGMGADLSVAQVARGVWDNSRLWQFESQACLTLLALPLIAIATAIGTTSQPAPDRAANSRTDIVRELRGLRTAAEADKALQSRVAALEDEVRRLRAASRR